MAATCALLVAPVVSSCIGGTSADKQLERLSQIRRHDSLVEAELKVNPGRVLLVADSLEAAGAEGGELLAFYRALAYHGMGQKVKVEELCEKALEGDALLNDRAEVFYHACDLLSTTRTYREDNEGALAAAQKGLDVAKEDLTEKGRHWMAVLLHDVGYSEMRLGRIDEAEKCFSQAYIALSQIAASNQTYANLQTVARVAYNIVDAYNSTGQYDKARAWIESATDAVKLLVASPECAQDVKEDYIGGLAIQKAIMLVRTGHRVEADAAYDEAMKMDYAETDLGIVERADYLEKAERWDDLAVLQPRVDSLSRLWGNADVEVSPAGNAEKKQM